MCFLRFDKSMSLNFYGHEEIKEFEDVKGGNAKKRWERGERTEQYSPYSASKYAVVIGCNSCLIKKM